MDPSSTAPKTTSDRLFPLVDTHAHLEDSRVSVQLEEVLERARDAGVTQILGVGTTAEDSLLTLELAERHPGVFAAVGIQPNLVASIRAGDWGKIVALVDHPRVVAVGETGLDRFRDTTPFHTQQDYFDRHLDLAEEKNLPVVIHCRNCEMDIVEQLSSRKRPIRGVLHSFSGTWDHAQAFLELGLDISFAGMVTFETKKLDPLRDAAARVPLDRLLVETDTPYLSPHPYRGQSNEPARVALTAAFLARLRGIAPEALALATTANARRLFCLPDSDGLV